MMKLIIDTININTSTIARGNHKGEKTHHQLQSKAPVNLATTNIIVNTEVKGVLTDCFITPSAATPLAQ